MPTFYRMRSEPEIIKTLDIFRPNFHTNYYLLTTYFP